MRKIIQFQVVDRKDVDGNHIIFGLCDDGTMWTIRDTVLGVLAHIVEGKPISKAFGSPGDWGYGTPIGDALARRG